MDKQSMIKLIKPNNMGRIKILVIVLILGIFTGNAWSQITPVKIDLYSNGNKLNADFYQVTGDAQYPTFILLPGMPGGEGDIFGLGKKLSSSGINVLIFNFQGTHSSEGTNSFENSMEDVGAAHVFLKKKENIESFNIDTTNIVAGGWSYGGAMALTAAIYNPEIKRIISIAGADESVFARRFESDPEFYKMFYQMMNEITYPKGPIKRDIDIESAFDNFLNNQNNYDLVKHADALKNRDILLLGGWKDQNIVLEDHILPLYRKLQELNAEHVKIKVFDTNHGFTNVREELAETITNWISLF
jgi:dipeptidyl aminopeptidase/acylaminoacyl peptidase